MQYFICDCAGKIDDVTSIGGSVVEFSPATRETGVRFPANATFVLHNMNAGQIFYLYMIVQGFLIVDVTSIGGSVVEFSPATRETGVRFPANATFVFNMNAIFYM